MKILRGALNSTNICISSAEDNKDTAKEIFYLILECSALPQQ